MSQDRKTASGGGDARSFERAEALIDEAVGQAAKGSYREAADKAEQALAIDPENAAARDLLDSYRRQVTDDDERRRRRRSIAAAAAAIEEMVENDRLDEASSATDALAMQFGLDAPVEELRRSIAEARAELLDFDELDAAIDSIRVNDARPSQPGRAEPGGAIAAEVEEHLRAGRLDEASRAVSRLEREPDSTERAIKLRTRIEEAMHVAAEHRREEEILIATAAIEERIRRGSIDDAAERLAELNRQHGDKAPVAELGQRLAEARALRVQKVEAVEVEAAPEPVSTSAVSAPVFQSMVGEESSGRGRSIAIAAVVVIALGAGSWWLLQRGGENGATVASEPAATVASEVSDDGLSPAGSTGAESSTADTTEPSSAATGSVAPPAGAPLVPSTAQQNEAAAPATGTEPRRNEVPAPATAPGPQGANPARPNASQADAAPPPAVAQRPPSVSAQAPPPVEATQNATAPVTADAPAQPPSVPETTEVVVEAVPAAELPPPPPPAPVDPPAPASPSTADASAPAESAAPAPPPPSEAAPQPAAETRPAVVAEAPRASAPAAASGPVILGCGSPGVVCVKALQVPTPRYPAQARARRLSGNVVVMALVNEQGRVVQARVDSGSFAFFNEAALDAARRAIFQPATRQGVAGQSWARLTFKFEEQ